MHISLDCIFYTAMKHLKQILSGDPDNKSAFTFFKILKALSKKKAEADAYYKSRNYEKAVDAYSEALLLTGCVGQYKAKVLFNRACCGVLYCISVLVIIIW